MPKVPNRTPEEMLELLSQLSDDDLSEMFKAQEALERNLEEFGPQDDDELHEWLKKELKLDIPRVAVCQGHQDPFSFLADLFFQRTEAALLMANRGGSKTYLVAVLHWLNSKFKPGCVAADTPIDCPRDHHRFPHGVPISQIHSGQLVWTFNEDEFIFELKPVVRVWMSREDAAVYLVTLDDGSVIRATADHRFMRRDGAWAELRDLAPGDSLMPLYRDWEPYVRVRPDATNGGGIVSIEPDGSEDVWDLEVADNHNFVTAGVVLHNCESCTFGATEAQSLRAYSHLKSWIYDDKATKSAGKAVLRPEIASSLMRETIFMNGSKVEVLPGTPQAVNGPHPQVAHADEIELMDDGTWRESRNMTISKRTSDGRVIIPQDIATSTRKGPNGRMQMLIDEITQAVAQGYKPPRKLYQWCFPPGTLVRTLRGFVPIEDVNKGDSVLSEGGVYRKVSDTHVRNIESETIYSIKTPTNVDILVTAEHPFMAVVDERHQKVAEKPKNKRSGGFNTGWVNASDLSVGSFIQSVVPSEDFDLTSVSPPISTLGDQSDGRCRKSHKTYELTEDFLWAVGLYIAEGHAVQGAIAFSLNENETEYIERLRRIFESYGFGVTEQKTTGACTAVHINSTQLSEWWENWIGKGCQNKIIPEEIFSLGLDKLRHVVDGVMDGDGSRSVNTLGQTSKILGMQMTEIALRENGNPSLHVVNKDNKKTVYHLYQADGRVDIAPKYVSGSGKRSHNSPRGFWKLEGETFVKVAKHEKVHYCGPVYDLTVEGNPSFVVGNLLVHNCIKETAEQVKSCQVANPSLGEEEKCGCHLIRKGEWEDGSPRLLKQICNGDFYRSRGWQPFGDVAKQFTENDRETFEVQQLCSKPEMRSHYVPGWRDEKHCIRNYAPDPDNGPIFQAVDWGGCYDGETEVLTARGWIPFPDVSENDEFASLDLDTKKVVFQKPDAVIKKEYGGAMERYLNRSVDLLVSADHNMLVAPIKSGYGQNRDWRIVRSDSLSSRGSGMCVTRTSKGRLDAVREPFVLQGIEKGGSLVSPHRLDDIVIDPEDWAALLGFWMAEGHTHLGKNNRGERRQFGDVGFTHYNRENIEQIKRIAGKYFTVLDRVDYDNNLGQLRICDPRLYSYLAQFGKAKDKFLPDSLKRWDAGLLAIYLDWHMRGDGHIDHDGKRIHSRRITTVSKSLADGLQEIAMYSGKAAVVSVRDGRESEIDGRIIPTGQPEYTISFVEKRLEPQIASKIAQKYVKTEISPESWGMGMVYCVHLPEHHTLYVRRNGKPVWSGNSNPHAVNWYHLLKVEVEVETWIQPDDGNKIYKKRLKEGTIVCFDEIYIAEIGNDKLGELVKDKESRWKLKFPKFNVYERFADPAGKAARLDWKAMGLKCSWHTTREFEEHIKDVRGVFDDDAFFVDGERCPMFVKEIKEWRANPKTGHQIDTHNHCMSELRYCISNLKKVRRKALGINGGASLPSSTPIPRAMVRVTRPAQGPVSFRGNGKDEFSQWRKSLGGPVTDPRGK